LGTAEMPRTVHMPIAKMAENEEWLPWDLGKRPKSATEGSTEGGTTTEAAAERLLDDTTSPGEAEAEAAPVGVAHASVTDNTAAALAAEEKAIAVVEEAVKAATEAAAVAKEAQAALSAEEAARGGGGAAPEGPATTEAPWAPGAEVGALK